MLGNAIAPIIAGLIAQNIGLRSVFVMTATGYVMAVALLAAPALREARSQRREAAKLPAEDAESTQPAAVSHDGPKAVARRPRGTG